MNTKTKLTLFILLLAVLGIFTPSRKISALVTVDSNGNLVYGSVLGDEDEDDEDEDEDEDEDDDDKKEENKYEYKYENNGEKYEYKYEVKDDGRIEYEYKSESENDDSKNKIEIKSKTQTTSPLNQLKELRLRSEDGRIRVESENEYGDLELENESETEIEIEEHQNKSKIKVKTEENNTFRVQKDDRSAISRFPLTIDLTTNSLIVNTPSGSKVVSVLPDEAVKNLLRLNIVDTIESGEVEQDQAITDQVETGVFPVQPTSSDGDTENESEEIEIEEEEGVLVYKIKGTSSENMLGFFPVTIEKEATVNAETGEVMSVKLSIVDRIIDLISF